MEHLWLVTMFQIRSVYYCKNPNPFQFTCAVLIMRFHCSLIYHISQSNAMRNIMVTTLAVFANSVVAESMTRLFSKLLCCCRFRNVNTTKLYNKNNSKPGMPQQVNRVLIENAVKNFSPAFPFIKEPYTHVPWSVTND